MGPATPVALVGPLAPWVTVAAAVELAVVTIWFVRLGPPARLRALTSKSMPELRWHYSADELADYLEVPGVRQLYRVQLRWDFAFIAFYGVGFSLLVDGTWGRLFADRPRAMQVVPLLLPALLLPALLVVADIIEDSDLLAALAGDMTVERVRRASRATTAKKVLTPVVGAECAIGLALLATVGPRSG